MLDAKDEALIAANKRIMQLEHALMTAEAALRNSISQVEKPAAVMREAAMNAYRVLDPKKPAAKTAK